MRGSNANSVYRAQSTGIECDADVLFEEKNWDLRPTITVNLPRPVLVIKGEDGMEEIRYNSAVMDLGRIYQVVWNGKRYGLRKTETEVEILRFYPDDHEQGD